MKQCMHACAWACACVCVGLWFICAVRTHACMPSGHKVRGSPEELLELAKQTMLKREDVEVIDWWGPGVSPEGRRLRIRMDQKSLTAKSLDVGPGGREQAIPQRRLSRGDEVEAAEGK